ncbi:unnamed protein product [Zymoseptoria tritici ST99CH_1A5]|uniref:Uncharacterized protein n=2 Tax=Zymoseptoria tritici TaxID=1047171 RepID=F9XLY9_ZYMTI|nr:uncharacterized protein MYCGRDRAFT_96389 [Zymoseptoria tritici IPO323]EGP83947.1 hypothetical protein MYCGRDRAFT_96389 [Zymoseptoria tritici IPO323]SMY28573.1 unnamed protein product [Zymoseptoria tritici ST99CH_1A5]
MAPILAFSLYCLALLPTAFAENELYQASCQRKGKQDNGVTASICRQINKEQHFHNDWYWDLVNNECRFHNGDDPKQFGGAGWRRFTVLCQQFGLVPSNPTSCTMVDGGC